MSDATEGSRRLGARATTSGLDIEWDVGRADRRSRRERRNGPLDTLHGSIRDVSVSGAAVLAPPSPLAVGSPVQIKAIGLVGRVVVCRIDQDTDPGSDRVLYGIAFLDVPPALLDHLYQPLYVEPDPVDIGQAPKRR